MKKNGVLERGKKERKAEGESIVDVLLLIFVINFLFEPC